MCMTTTLKLPGTFQFLLSVNTATGARCSKHEDQFDYSYHRLTATDSTQLWAALLNFDSFL